MGESVFIAPHYETVSDVRRVLRNAGIDVSRYERENALVIMDTRQAYEKREGVYTFNLLINQLIERAKKLGKKGVSIFADGGLFFMYDGADELVNHEIDIPTELMKNASAFAPTINGILMHFQRSRSNRCYDTITEALPSQSSIGC